MRKRRAASGYRWLILGVRRVWADNFMTDLDTCGLLSKADLDRIRSF